MAGQSFWIKERYNPQLGTYFVAMGRLTVEEARRYEKPSYGSSTMHPFKTEEAYEAELFRLQTSGQDVQR